MRKITTTNRGKLINMYKIEEIFDKHYFLEASFLFFVLCLIWSFFIVCIIYTINNSKINKKAITVSSVVSPIG